MKFTCVLAVQAEYLYREAFRDSTDCSSPVFDIPEFTHDEHKDPGAFGAENSRFI